jgi:hypothetical protein
LERPIAQYIPFAIPLEFKVHGWLHGPMVAGDPTHLSVFGEDGKGRRGIVVTVEWPEHYRPASRKLSNEQLHLDRLNADIRWGCGEPFCHGSRPGADPPDFMVDAVDGEVGLDVTQFVLQERAAKFDALRRLKKEATTRGPSRFKHLRGHVCYIMFAEGVPPRASGAWQAAIDAMERVRPPQPPPKVLDELKPEAMEYFDAGVVSAAPLKSPEGRSPFFNVMGFELTYPFMTAIYEDEAFAHLQHLIEKHDKPGVDHLLVSISAPVVDGWAFASDGIAASLAQALAHEQPLRADHIQRVWLHFWPTRAINVFSPNTAGVEHLCGDDPPTCPNPMTVRPSGGAEDDVPLTEEQRREWEEWMLSRFGPSTA